MSRSRESRPLPIRLALRWVAGGAILLVGGWLAAWAARPPEAPEAPEAGPERPAPMAEAEPTTDSLNAMPVEPGHCGAQSCHESLRYLPTRHGPAAKGGCLPCHVSIDGRHRFEETPMTAELCRSCHKPYPEDKLKHPDVEKDCQECHDPHGGDQRHYLKGGSVGALCLRCHAEDVSGEPKHKPVAEGECLSCHELHHAEGGVLQRSTSGTACLQCHFDYIHDTGLIRRLQEQER